MPRGDRSSLSTALGHGESRLPRGRFGAMMTAELLDDGPVTLVVDATVGGII